MKIRCINNEGVDLRPYEYEVITNNKKIGRFGSSEISKYEIEIGKEYFVMGIIIFRTYQAYLIDDNDFIATYPCQLFETSDNSLDSNWHFRIVDRNENIYPFVQAIFGYPELCSDKNAYENLIIEMDTNAQQIYFKRKNEISKQ